MDSRFMARLVLAFVFFYHGLVPKILFLSPVELDMIQSHGLNVSAEWVAVAGGVLEISLALLLLFLRHRVWPVWIAMIMLVLLLVDVTIFAPYLLTGAFNPVTTNIAAIGLCLVALGRGNSQERLQ